MTNVGEVLDWLDRKTQTSEDTTAMDLWELFAELPLDLDLASAKYYMKKEFKNNDTGMDQRFEIHTFDAESYDELYDEDDDEDEDFDDWYCCEDCG